MRTIDTIRIAGPLDRVFAAARDVERWPEILPHYRWVRVLQPEAVGVRGEPEAELSGSPGGALPAVYVEMAAWRPFGLFNYPTWWVSRMTVDPDRHEVRYRHVRGITRGMDVVWRMAEGDGGVDVEIMHEWAGPRWPLIGRLAAELVIGPVFIHGIASRTLAGIKRFVEGGR